MRPLLLLASLLLAPPLLAQEGDSAPDVTPATDGTLLASWVQFPDSEKHPGVWLARAIVENAGGYADCPTMSTGGTMTPRATNADPTHFPVLVCEAAIDPGQALTLTAEAGPPTTFSFLPHTGHLGDRIAVMADSGCRGGTPSGPEDYSKQNCDTSFPLAAIATATAKESPSAVIHLGDYLYRQRGGCSSGTPCDTWDNWRDDFFTPAADLLAAAPWVFTRGNHETCGASAGSGNPYNDGGRGWFYFLAPESAALGDTPTTCSSADPYDPPYAADLPFQRGRQSGTLRLLVLDSSTEYNPDYSDNFVVLDSLAADASREYWFVTHEPYIEMDKVEGSAPSYPRTQYSNTYVLNAYLASHTTQAHVQLSLAGHIHLGLQALIPDDDIAPMLIVGTSGVNMYGAPTDTSKTTTCEYSGAADWGSNRGGARTAPGLHLRGMYTYHQGSALITPDAARNARWSIGLRDAATSTRATCTVVDHAGGQPLATLDCDWAAIPQCSSPN